MHILFRAVPAFGNKTKSDRNIKSREEKRLLIFFNLRTDCVD
jgi:hypothetical protein